MGSSRIPECNACRHCGLTGQLRVIRDYGNWYDAECLACGHGKNGGEWPHAGAEVAAPVQLRGFVEVSRKPPSPEPGERQRLPHRTALHDLEDEARRQAERLNKKAAGVADQLAFRRQPIEVELSRKTKAVVKKGFLVKRTGTVESEQVVAKGWIALEWRRTVTVHVRDDARSHLLTLAILLSEDGGLHLFEFSGKRPADGRICADPSYGEIYPNLDLAKLFYLKGQYIRKMYEYETITAETVDRCLSELALL